MAFSNNRISIITNCSKKKLSGKAKAKDLYQGQFFSLIKHIAEQNSMDLFILSAKYGLISAEKEIESYDQRIKTKADVIRLRTLSNKLFNEILQRYSKVLLIMGREYQSVLDEFQDTKIFRSSDNRGSGGYLQLASEISHLSRSDLIQFLHYLEKTNEFISVISLASFFSHEKPEKRLIQSHIFPIKKIA